MANPALAAEAGCPRLGRPGRGMWGGRVGRVAGIGGCRCSGDTRGRADRSLGAKMTDGKTHQEDVASDRGQDTPMGLAPP